jgi:uncharacterized surface protein with fasciclin (FAS1) repeats
MMSMMIFYGQIRERFHNAFCVRKHGMSKIEQVLQGLTSPYTFNNLAMLLNAAGLEYTLQGNRPLTLFAPHDLTFDTLQQRTGFDLLTNIDKLNLLMRYHIVPLKLNSAELRKEAIAEDVAASDQVLQLPTEAEGYTLRARSGNPLQINGVRVVQADIEAENGIIHIIDGILWPAGLSELSFGERSTVHAPGEKERP